MSAEVMPEACSIALRLASRLAWVSTTPLGLPVLPEVYCRKAMSRAARAGKNGGAPGRDSSTTVASPRSKGHCARSRWPNGLARSSVTSMTASALARIPAMRRR